MPIEDEKQIYNKLKALGYDPHYMLVINIKPMLFGKDLIFECECGDPNEPLFRLILKDCTDMRWEVFGDDPDTNEPEARADIIGITRDDSGEATCIHTDLFEATVAHGETILDIGPHHLTM